MSDSDHNAPGPREFRATPGDAGKRLDRVAADRFPDLSRSALQSLIKAGHATANGTPVTRPRHLLAAGDRVRFEIPVRETGGEPEPEDIPLSVLFEDDDLIVVDKPAGLVVHPGAGNPGGTLVNALLHHCDGRLSRAGEPDRPGIVHRLDKETSGCLAAAKTDDAYRSLVAQFSGREVEKIYLAVVAGCPLSPSGRLENRIGRHPVNRQRMTLLDPPAGKLAVTDYQVIGSASDGAWSVVRCVIHTGRTHQIRVHLKECLRCPILGDEIYGQPKRQQVKAGRMMLHAWKLALRHPVTEDRLAFESPLPEEFERFTSLD